MEKDEETGEMKMKKRVIAIILVMTLVWSSLGDIFRGISFAALAEEPEPATPAEEKPAAKPRKRTSRKKPAIDLTDEQMARLRKMAPGSRQKLLNTLVHLKVPNAEATAVALIANKVLEILPDNHVNWLAQ